MNERQGKFFENKSFTDKFVLTPQFAGVGSREVVMTDNTNNKEFWNEYVKYFENKIEEANNDTDAKDKTASDKVYSEYYKKLAVGSEEKLLDFGCGFGRLYPIYKEYTGMCNGYYGIDVSERELELAEKKYTDLKIGKSLFEYDGMSIPFQDDYFDKIICWGVFDACYQEMVIRELLRVLKLNGLLLITGKNNNYFDDDEAAVIAEVNARKKGHPNYFTDVDCLVRQLLEHNASLVEEYYFLRRGDSPKNQAVYKMPEKFYEWTFLIEKTEGYKDFEYQKFSNKFSKHFR